MRWMMLAVVLVGCSDDSGGKGKSGADGLTGPAGPTGPAGEGGGFAWFDANGEQVTAGEALLYWDEAGVAWTVDQWTGELAPPELSAVNESPTCTGAEFVSQQDFEVVMVPRVGYKLLGRRVYLTRPDDLQLEPELTWLGEMDSGTCRLLDPYTVPGLYVDDLVEVELPEVAWAPPLHPEPL